MSERPLSQTEGAKRLRALRDRRRRGAVVVRHIEIPQSFIELMVQRGLTSPTELHDSPERFRDAVSDALELIAEGRLAS
jgi:hypothetical protein